MGAIHVSQTLQSPGLSLKNKIVWTKHKPTGQHITALIIFIHRQYTSLERFEPRCKQSISRQNRIPSSKWGHVHYRVSVPPRPLPCAPIPPSLAVALCNGPPLQLAFRRAYCVTSGQLVSHSKSQRLAPEGVGLTPTRWQLQQRSNAMRRPVLGVRTMLAA